MLRHVTMSVTSAQRVEAAAREVVQAYITHGRTLRYGPTEACQSSRETAQLMMATRHAGSRLRASEFSLRGRRRLIKGGDDDGRMSILRVGRSYLTSPPLANAA